MVPIGFPHPALQLPRWEWRTLAPSLEGVRQALAGIPTESLRDIRETYLLCLRSSHNAKVRGEQVDLKWRKRVNTQGLELWDPIFKARFPLGPEDLLQLFGGWGMSLPSLELEAYGFQDFRNRIIEPNPHLKAVDVQKTRRGFTLDGTTCELVDIRIGEALLESFCVEHEDPDLVMQVLTRLGFDSHKNINYPKGLKAALANRAA